jgi:hypothetical protein
MPPLHPNLGDILTADGGGCVDSTNWDYKLNDCYSFSGFIKPFLELEFLERAKL